MCSPGDNSPISCYNIENKVINLRIINTPLTEVKYIYAHKSANLKCKLAVTSFHSFIFKELECGHFMTFIRLTYSI